MLLLYILLLGALALLTAYTRNFQRTLVALDDALDAPGGMTPPRAQGLRTAAVLVAWPVGLAVGMAFFAWWKAVVLVLLAFMVLVPLLGTLTPRPLADHYLGRIRADLERRLAVGDGDPTDLRRTLEVLDGLSRPRTG
jgi:hypothetical protein